MPRSLTYGLLTALLALGACAPRGMGLSWRVSDLGDVLSQPAVIEDAGVVVVSDIRTLIDVGARVVGFNMRNGKELWETEGTFTLPVVSPGGDVVYATGAEELLCVDADGAERWRVPLGGGRPAGVAISDDGLIWVTESQALEAFDDEGVLQWSIVVGASAAVNLVIAPDGTLFFQDAAYQLNAVSPDGSILWQTQLGLAADDLMYQDGPVVVHATGLIAVNPSDGTTRWEFELPTEEETQTGRPSQPIVTEDGTLVMSTRHGVIGVDEGELAWRGDVGCRGMAAAKDGRIYSWCNMTEYIEEHRPLAGVQLFDVQHTVLSGNTGEPVWWPTKPAFEAITLGGTGEPFGSPALDRSRAVYTHAINVYDVIALSRAPGLADSQWPRAHGNNQNSGQARP